MTTLTITAKGQVTLKQDLLKHLGVGPGEKVEADKLPDGRIMVKAAAQDGGVADFVGCLSQNGGRKLTIDEMNEITARSWAKANENPYTLTDIRAAIAASEPVNPPKGVTVKKMKKGKAAYVRSKHSRG